MPGNMADAERAAFIHERDCKRDNRRRRYGRSIGSDERCFLGYGSYRCAFRIRGVVYKVEHQWYNHGRSNDTEYQNSLLARKHGLRIVPPVTQFKVRLEGVRRTIKVNAMPYYKHGTDAFRGGNWYDALCRALKNTPLVGLDWDAGSRNVRCTPTGQLRIVDAADS